MIPASSMTIPNSARSVKPMVLSTAISPVRSRALIIIAFAVTSRIANTTAMPMVPISRLTLPHMVAKLALNACSVPVLVGALELRNWSSSVLRDRGGIVGVVDLQDVPPRQARPPDPLLQVFVMEQHHVVVDDRIGRRVDPADGEGPVAREDGALEGDVLAQPPAEQVEQPAADDRGGALAEEGLLLVLRQDDLGVDLEVRLRVHRELGEEALVVPVLAAEPVGPGDLGDALRRAEPVGVAQRQREHEARWRWSSPGGARSRTARRARAW